MTDLSQYTDKQLMGMLSQQVTSAPEVPQNNSFLRDPAIAASGVTKGFSAATSIPGEVGAAYDKFIGRPFSKAMGVEPNESGLKDVLGGTAEQNLDYGHRAGFIDNPALQPQNEGEKLLSAGGQGVGANLAFAPLAPASTLPGMLVQGAGAGVGGQAASDASGGNPLLSFLGSLGGGGLASGVTGLVEKGINAVAGKTSPVLQAYKEAGVTPRLVGDVSGDANMQGMQAFASKAPFGAGQVRNAAQKTTEEFGKSVDNLASQFGDSRTLEEAGNAVHTHGRAWLNNFKLQSKTAWNDVDKAVGETPVQLKNTEDMIGAMKANSDGNPAIQSFLESDNAKRFQGILAMQKRPAGGLESLYGGPQPATVPWNTIKALRSRVGEYLENPSLVADAGGAQAKQLYAALSQDMRGGLEASGNSQALGLFDKANATSSAGHTFIENVLQPVMDKDPSKAAKALLQSGTTGGETLAALRTQMPKAADELAAVSLRRQMAGQSEGSFGNTVSPSRWLSEQDPTRRLSPEAHQALYANPVAQSKMRALDTVAQSMRETEQFVNHSNSAANLEHAALWSAPEVIGGATWAGHEAGGLPGAIGAGAAASLPYMAGPISGRIATSPWLARFMSTPSTTAPFGFAPSLISAQSRGSQ